tara:strand:- start:657 stop:860 length:204 start_codon:yes stop_codon:yes gene_type:complete
MTLDEEELKERLQAMMIEHRDLDDSIDALMAQSHVDRIQIQRLKKKKLLLKDEIIRIENQLIPDIIA